MPLYFGRPGGMVVLPDPNPGVPLNPVRRTAELITLGGGRTVDVMGLPRLDITLKWSRLTADELHVLEGFHYGANGPGPWWILPVDVPGWNFLHPIPAAATSLTFDPSGWLTTDGTVESVDDQVLRGPRSLYWYVVADPGNDRWLWVEGPGVPYGLPLGGTGAWTFTFNARTVSGTATVFAQLSGTTHHDGPDTTIGSTGWTQVSVTYTPTADESLALFAGVRPGPVAELFIDTPRLTHGASVQPWTPGRGTPRVAITDLAVTAAWTDAYDVTMTLREVG